ncbi:MAG: type II and III secretion system protein [Pirellulales bacterium]|nr:type II and III secretion system protein [Pirellulales bacterium]
MIGKTKYVGLILGIVVAGFLYPKPVAAQAVNVQAASDKTPAEGKKQQVHILMHLLSIEPAQSAAVKAMVRQHYPRVEFEPNAMANFGNLDSQAVSELVRSLTANKLAEVISRPQVITVAGEKAVLQVGQTIELPIAEEPGKTKSREIGFKIQCTPEVLKENRLRLALNINHSSVDEDHKIKTGDVEIPVIKELDISTAVDLESGDTISLGGHTGRGTLLLLLRAEMLLERSQPAPKVLLGGPVQAQVRLPAPSATEAAAASGQVVGSLGHVRPELAIANPPQVPEIREKLQQLLPGSKINVQLAHPHLTVSADVDSVPNLNELLQSIGHWDQIRLHSVQSSSRNGRFNLRILGELQRPAVPVRASVLDESVLSKPPLPGATSSRLMNLPATRLKKLRDTLRELFPDEKIELHPLEHSILLRGSVNQRSVPVIQRVVEDYYAQVVNDLVVIPSQSSPQPKAATESRMIEEIQQLRGEVKALNADVKRLIRMLDTEQASDANQTRRPKDQESQMTKRRIANRSARKSPVGDDGDQR